eukprot:TRINITY_DN41106_c0_g1_i1.p1 TRINITY_DN41106_c0_g1~~TRINITY_DN41106_c0_g1_i1.p1  ORF type:complete len:642 (+),score=133.59 TRINITY_DN41106_c0_g1_i1:27-1928(+)
MDIEDVDVYFAEHDIQSVISDVMYELGFHRPQDVGPFLASYVARRFALPENQGSTTVVGSRPKAKDWDQIQVHQASQHPTAEEQLSAQMIIEARVLRRKYANFQAEVTSPSSADEAQDVAAFNVITWAEFQNDYERLLQILGHTLTWNFCERRLTALRGLFDAHRGLNAVAEDKEVKGQTPPRVDNCVQLARALPPGRLMDIVQSLMSGREDEEEPETENRLQQLISESGQTPGPMDLTADADANAPPLTSLKGLFSCIANPVHGAYLRQIASASIDLLEQTSSANSGQTFAEYRIPLLAESAAWTDLTRWYQELNEQRGEPSTRAKWVIQLSQLAFGGLKERRTVLNFGELLSNAFGPLIKQAVAKPHEEQAEEWKNLQALLDQVAAIEVTAFAGGAEPMSAEANREPADWTEPTCPPFMYQIYHVWARLKGLNREFSNHGKKELQLRASASGPEGIACAYLLGASSISRCAALASHATLQYLFMLDNVGVPVSLCSKRSLGGVGETGRSALDKLFRAGVRVALCTEDPSVSHQGDGALTQEFIVARAMLGLSDVDVAELCHNSRLISCFPELQPQETSDKDVNVDDETEEKDDEEEQGPKRSIRERFRLAQLEAELAFLASLVPEQDKANI